MRASVINADAHRAAIIESARRERYKNDENDKEQSGAETVKIAAGSLGPSLHFNRSSPRDGAILQ
jgi:F0F1-type ATP synthase membrane subunit b/b'